VGINKPFKVAVPFEELEKVNAHNFWPKGVVVR
jgi:hypothetical protein